MPPDAREMPRDAARCPRDPARCREIPRDPYPYLSPPQPSQAVFHTIFGADTTPKLQQAGCQLAQHVATHAADPLLAAAGSHLLAGMLKVLAGEPTATLRADSPEVRNHLSRRA